MTIVHEKEFQRSVRRILAEEGRLWRAECGAVLQILSVGEWNIAGGADFRAIALIADGELLVGDGEFHRKASDWTAHRHDDNPAYANLLLHIVCRNDAPPKGRFTLVLPEELLKKNWDKTAQFVEKPTVPDDEIMQEYALRRLHRKTALARNFIKEGGENGALKGLLERFLEQQRRSTRRPNGISRLNISAELLARCSFALDIFVREPIQDGAEADNLLRTVLPFGKGSRREFLTNILCPIANALGGGEHSNVWRVYWTLEAAHRYGALARKFPDQAQKFVWQQQGLLEYLQECGFSHSKIREKNIPYSGFYPNFSRINS